MQVLKSWSSSSTSFFSEEGVEAERRRLAIASRWVFDKQIQLMKKSLSVLYEPDGLLFYVPDFVMKPKPKFSNWFGFK